MNTSLTAIGLINPKSAENVATILRAAGCYGVSSVFYTGQRYAYAKAFKADTQKIHKKIPVVGVEDLRPMVPKGAVPVAIELVEGATSLPDFKHPVNAFYVFGPEDGSLRKDVLDWCEHVVYIPTNGSMNLAATANVVLYDRLAKSENYPKGDELIRRSRDNNNKVSIV